MGTSLISYQSNDNKVHVTKFLFRSFTCYKDYIAPGFNEHVKELHAIARHYFVSWKHTGTPPFGEVYFEMNQSRINMKSERLTVYEDRMCADTLAMSIYE